MVMETSQCYISAEGSVSNDTQGILLAAPYF